MRGVRGVEGVRGVRGVGGDTKRGIYIIRFWSSNNKDTR